MAFGMAATLSFSIPLRNMHSAFEVIQPDDAEAGALLAAAVARRVAAGLGARALRATRLGSAERVVPRARARARTGLSRPGATGARPPRTACPASRSRPAPRGSRSRRCGRRG